MQRAFVGAGGYLQRSVFLGDFVDHQEGSHQIIITVRRERKVLMPLNNGGCSRQLGVDLGMMQLDVGPDQIGDRIGHAAVRHRLIIGVRHFDRRIHPPKCRLFRVVSTLQIEARPAV